MNAHDIQLLSKGFEFRGETLNGEVVETHISWVILTRQYAFKIKKPLRFSFLDFSTLSIRKQVCEKELSLNRRYSDIYLEVAPLSRDGNRWSFDRTCGEALDYAVVMKRLQSAKRMDKMLDAGSVTVSGIKKLARLVATHHAEAEVVASPFDEETIRSSFNDIRTIIPGVTRWFGPAYGHVVSKSMLWSDSFLQINHGRLAARATLGYRRDLHGDLHSGNIFLYSKPIIFDCIEFNDEFRRIDVLDEVAFLCMDLESFNAPGLARTFLACYNKLLPAIHTETDAAIFTYYKCYRANVRAKVHVLAAAQDASSTSDREFHRNRAAEYINLIRRYAN